MEILDVILAFLSLVLIWYSFHNKNGCPSNWPFFGMVPGLIKNFHRINDFSTEILEKTDLTFTFAGPWFTNMKMLVTADPCNVQHITSKNFQNYVKGFEFNNEICDFFGETIVNSDSSNWVYLRTLAQYIFKDPRFQKFFFTKVWEKVEMGLIPVLNHISHQGLEIDLQDLLTRFSFDVTCSLILNYDPESLSADQPIVSSLTALDDIAEGILHRSVTPKRIWKLQKLLGIGQEKKLGEACKTIDNFLYKTLATWLNDKNDEAKEINDTNADILTLMVSYQKQINSSYHGNNIKFFRDTFLSLLFAGRDTISTTLSWFFYVLSKNPQALSKIKDELDLLTVDIKDEDIKSKQFTLSSKFKELDSKLVYLHAALCETLRLYPPIPFEFKTAVESDVLPSNNQVTPNTKIIIGIYSMARMPSIWGNDCRVFKPERWISETGKIKNVPSYKFFTFLSGPRSCLGKSISFTQLKAVAIAILKNYHIQAAEDHPIVPGASMVLRMKYGFKAKVTKSM